MAQKLMLAFLGGTFACVVAMFVAYGFTAAVNAPFRHIEQQ